MPSPQPYFRKFDGWWYVQTISPEGKRRQVKLVKGLDQKDQAFQRFYELMAQKDPASAPDRSKVTVAAYCDLFLEWQAKHQSPKTFDWYQRFLQSFCDVSGTVTASDLKPFHVTRWVDAHTKWGQSSQRAAMTAIKRVFNWAVAEGYLEASPLRGLRRPACGRREKIITVEEHQNLLAESWPDFQDFLTALWETGARPGEVAAVTAANYDRQQSVWILREHKTAKKTGRPRVIYLTDSMVTMTERLALANPTGPLFRNSDGLGWNNNSIRCRFRRLRAKFENSDGTVAYAYRHTWTTRALLGGVPIATAAELLGHADTEMISAHYSHLSQQVAHLRQAARQVAGEAG